MLLAPLQAVQIQELSLNYVFSAFVVYGSIPETAVVEDGECVHCTYTQQLHTLPALTVDMCLSTTPLGPPGRQPAALTPQSTAAKPFL